MAYIIPGYYTFKSIEKRGGDDVKEWAAFWCVCWRMAFAPQRPQLPRKHAAPAVPAPARPHLNTNPPFPGWCWRRS